MAGAVFRGMEPWALDAGIIECEATALGLVDLHNDSEVAEVVLVPGSTVQLRFRHGVEGRAFALVFSGVSGFRATELEHHPNDARLFHELSHVPVEGAGVSEFEIVLAALCLVFRAGGVEFRTG